VRALLGQQVPQHDVPKVAILLDFSCEFRVSTSDLNHFAREETVLAGLRF
jgi:hypothetical protein